MTNFEYAVDELAIVVRMRTGKRLTGKNTEAQMHPHTHLRYLYETVTAKHYVEENRILGYPIVRNPAMPPDTIALVPRAR